MLSHEITTVAGKYKARKRIGRGNGSGSGKTAGRGHKGAHSRAGFSRKRFHEGGQMPLFRRIPKRGFSNYDFATRYEIVNVSQLDRFEEGTVVNAEQLCKVGLVSGTDCKVKVLGNGELTKKLEVVACKFSKSAEEKITNCGGQAKIVA